MAASWHVAPALVRLRSELNQKHPNRSKSSDGTIGDANHSARASDHNPNSRRSVNAIDITAKGVDMGTLLAVMKADRRTNYIIFNRVIYSRSQGFRPRAYFGPNPHRVHVHISILQSSRAEQDSSSWGLGSTTSPGLPSSGAEGPSHSSKPSPPAPKEDTLSAAEVAELKAHTETMFRALQKQGFDRAPRDDQSIQTAKLVASNGFNRPVLELIGEAAARQSHAKIRGEVAANRVLLEQIQKAGGFSDAMMDEFAQKAEAVTFKASKEGVEAGAAVLTVQLSAVLSDVLGDLVSDLGKDFDEETRQDITDRLVTEIAGRLAPEGAKA